MLEPLISGDVAALCGDTECGELRGTRVGGDRREPEASFEERRIVGAFGSAGAGSAEFPDGSELAVAVPEAGLA